MFKPRPFWRRSKRPDPAELTLMGHLNELRSRLIKSVSAVVAGAVFVYIFNRQVIEFLQGPYCQLSEANDQDCEFLLTRPMEGFSTVLAVTGYGGLLLAMPVILYQLARFVLPGLYPNERRVLWPFFGVSVVLMAIGMVGGYLLMPKTLGVLQSFGTEAFVEQYSPQAYIGLFVKMMLAFGVAAELPLVLVFLQLIGILATETLRSNRRLVLVAVVILAAVITPTGDPFTLLVMAVPMYLSYELSMIVGGRFTKRRHPVTVGS